ncbi:MAG: hypothetical protein ACC652_06545 [Acidimicrobiales bacterium]
MDTEPAARGPFTGTVEMTPWGGTRIAVPGSSLAEPLAEDEEGILYAACDPASQAIAK